MWKSTKSIYKYEKYRLKIDSFTIENKIKIMVFKFCSNRFCTWMLVVKIMQQQIRQIILVISSNLTAQ